MPPLISSTGVRSGEFVIGVGNVQTEGAILQVRGGFYPPTLHFVQMIQPNEIYGWLSQFSFFEPMTPEERLQYLYQNVSGKTEHTVPYLNEIPGLEIRFVRLPTGKKSSAFLHSDKIIPVTPEVRTKLGYPNTTLSIPDMLLNGNPSDPEGFWPMITINNLFKRKVGSKASATRHTLYFRPSNWMLYQPANTAVEYSGLFFNIETLQLSSGTITEDKSHKIYVVDLPNYKLGLVTPLRPISDGPYDLDNMLLLAATTFNYDIAILKNISQAISWFPPSMHKSLIQKLIRTRCREVSLQANVKYPASAVLLVTFCSLMVRGKSFVPQLNKSSSGLESATKRLAVSIAEDSFTGRTDLLTNLLAVGNVAQLDDKWQPPNQLIIWWLNFALEAQNDIRYFVYDWHEFNGQLPNFNYDVLNYWLLNQIKSFPSDIAMMGSIAQLQARPGPGLQIKDDDTGRLPVMPIIHSLDHHSFSNIAHFLYPPKSDWGPDYSKVFKEKVWMQVVGINSRKPDHQQQLQRLIASETENIPDIQLVRQAQSNYWISQSYKQNMRPETQETITLNYEIDSSWLAGLIGPIKFNIGSDNLLGVLQTDNLFEYKIIRKPSRDGPKTGNSNKKKTGEANRGANSSYASSSNASSPSPSSNYGGTNYGGGSSSNYGGSSSSNYGGSNYGGANYGASNYGGANYGGANYGGPNYGGPNYSADAPVPDSACQEPPVDKSQDITPELKEQGIQYVTRLLSDGYKLTDVPESLSFLKNAIVRLWSEDYWININNNWFRWDELRKLSYTLPVHPSLTPSIQSAILYSGNGVDAKCEEILQYILRFHTVVLTRLLIYIDNYDTIITLYPVGRDGTGSEHKTSVIDSTVNHILACLAIAYPAAIKKTRYNYTVTNGPLFWSIRDRIQNMVRTKPITISPTYNTSPTYNNSSPTYSSSISFSSSYSSTPNFSSSPISPSSNFNNNNKTGFWTRPLEDTRVRYEHQTKALNRIIARHKQNKKGHLMWINTGMGKTIIVLDYIQYLIEHNSLPPYVIYTTPLIAIDNLIVEIERRKMPYKLMDARKDHSEYEHTPEPGMINIIRHNHLILPSVKDKLNAISSQALVIVDEFDECFNETQRTSMSIELVTDCYDMVGMSATIIRDKNHRRLVKWLKKVVEFEVTEKNFWVAVGSIVSSTATTGIMIDRREINVKMSPEVQVEYKTTVPQKMGGNAQHLNFSRAVDICYQAITEQMINYIRQFIQSGEGVFVVARNTKHQDEIISELHKFIPANAVYAFGRGAQAITLTPDYQGPIRIVVTTPRHDRGYTLTKFRIMIQPVFFSNQATRIQLDGRLDRIGQTSPVIQIYTLHTGILSLIWERYQQVRKLTLALKGFADEAGLDYKTAESTLLSLA